MQAIRFHAYGGPEQLVLERAPRPELLVGTVLVRVHAAGVNPIDWKIRQGWLKNSMSLSLPHIPGTDMAGVIEEIGPGVTAFQKGQAVFGTAMSGSYAEYALANTNSLAPKPASLSFDEAAAVPLGAMTAWHALFDFGGLQEGQRILIHGAAGGVGMFAVQLARWKGAHVIGTASARNADFVRSLGAETVIDYQATPFETVVHGVDVVVDAIGGDVQDRSWQVLRPGGILVSLLGQPSEAAAKEHGVRATAVSRQRYQDSVGELLRQIGQLIESGQIRVAATTVFPLAEARQAHAMSEQGHGRGRIVLHVAD
jgi:NADPH:quinone reductase-like Zn-dependent oxidoreductase